ncbi:MAG: zinc ribbon domain-containing protein, partial [Planctomycetaceae bacterium]
MAEDRFCSACGTPYAFDDSFCANCGLARSESSPEANAPDTSQQPASGTPSDETGYFSSDFLRRADTPQQPVDTVKPWKLVDDSREPLAETAQQPPRRTPGADEGYFTKEELGEPSAETPQQPLNTVTPWEQSVELSPMDEPQDISQETERGIPETLESPEPLQPAPVGTPAGGLSAGPQAAGGLSWLPNPLPVIAGGIAVVGTLVGGFVAFSGDSDDDARDQQIEQSNLCEGENASGIVCPDDEGPELSVEQDDDDDDGDDEKQTNEQSIECGNEGDGMGGPLPFDRLYVQAPGDEGRGIYSLEAAGECERPEGEVELSGEFDDILI